MCSSDLSVVSLRGSLCNSLACLVPCSVFSFFFPFPSLSLALSAVCCDSRPLVVPSPLSPATLLRLRVSSHPQAPRKPLSATARPCCKPGFRTSLPNLPCTLRPSFTGNAESTMSEILARQSRCSQLLCQSAFASHFHRLHPCIP